MAEITSPTTVWKFGWCFKETPRKSWDGQLPTSLNWCSVRRISEPSIQYVSQLLKVGLFGWIKPGVPYDTLNYESSWLFHRDPSSIRPYFSCQQKAWRFGGDCRLPCRFPTSGVSLGATNYFHWSNPLKLQDMNGWSVGPPTIGVASLKIPIY